jgi:hypothetical protein
VTDVNPAARNASEATVRTAGALLGVVSIPLAIVALIVLGSFVSPSFLTVRNLLNVLNA